MKTPGDYRRDWDFPVRDLNRSPFFLSRITLEDEWNSGAGPYVRAFLDEAPDSQEAASAHGTSIVCDSQKARTYDPALKPRGT